MYWFFIVPHVDIELEDNKQFISNIPRIIISTNFVDLESLMLYTKIQLQSFLSFGDEDF